MRTQRRQMRFAIAIGVMFVSLVMCPALSAPKARTLAIWTGYAERVPVYKAAAADYIRDHPGVEIEITPFELRQSEQKFAIALPAGTAPDLFCTSVFLTHQFVKDKYLDPAPPEAKRWIVENWDPAYRDPFTIGGEIYGIPEVQGFQMLYYNLDHFKEAGLTEPPATLDELMACARKLAKYDDKGNLVRSGISLRISGGGSGIAQKFEVFLFANGGSVITPTGPGKWRADFANEAGYKALNFYLEALHKYKVDGFQIKHDSEAFVLGLASMFNRETYVIGDCKKRAPDMNYGITQVVGGSVQRATNLNLDAWIIPASGKNKDLAWDFAMYMQKDQYLVQMMRDVGWTCTRKGVDYSEVYKIEPHFKQALDRPKNMKLVPVPPAAALNEAQTKFSSRLVDAFADPSLLDNKDKIMRFLVTCADEVNEVLRSYGEYGE